MIRTSGPNEDNRFLSKLASLQNKLKHHQESIYKYTTHKQENWIRKITFLYIDWIGLHFNYKWKKKFKPCHHLFLFERCRTDVIGGCGDSDEVIFVRVEVLFHEWQNNFREELNVSRWSLEAGATAERPRGFQQFHINGCFVNVLDELFKETVCESENEQICKESQQTYLQPQVFHWALS